MNPTHSPARGEIRAIEETALNAWPGHRQMLLDGWLLRFAAGYTRRANSVQPIYPGSGELKRKIGRCEQIYQKQGLRCVFKITPLCQPATLAGTLQERGYSAEAPTSVQVLRLLPSRLAIPQAMALTHDLGQAGTWLRAYRRLNGVPRRNWSALRGILAGIAGHCAYATLRKSAGMGTPEIAAGGDDITGDDITVDNVAGEVMADEIVACGLGVLQGETLGLFDLVTHANHRRQGHAGRLIEGLLAWGRQQGATQAYLQVMLDNSAAHDLYARLGFKELYWYSYMVKEPKLENP